MDRFFLEDGGVLGLAGSVLLLVGLVDRAARMLFLVFCGPGLFDRSRRNLPGLAALAAFTTSSLALDIRFLADSFTSKSKPHHRN